MAHVDFKNRSITAKVVYYGCGLCGKTANLEYINSHSKNTGELLAVSTEGDRTIFFDFLPIELGKIRGISTKFKLYAVPGQVRYNMTRKLVLKDVDGVVFVVDSQRSALQANLESLQNLYDNLTEQGLSPDSIPVILQYNKRDLGNVMEVPELEKKINRKGCPSFASSAVTGEGVFETLDHVCRMVFDVLSRSLGVAQERRAEAAEEPDAVALSAAPPGARREAPDDDDIAAPLEVARPAQEPAWPHLDAAPGGNGAPALGDLAGKMTALVDELRLHLGQLEAMGQGGAFHAPAAPAAATPDGARDLAAVSEELARERAARARVDEALRQAEGRAVALTAELRAQEEARDQAGSSRSSAEDPIRDLEAQRHAAGEAQTARILEAENARRELLRARDELGSQGAALAELRKELEGQRLVAQEARAAKEEAEKRARTLTQELPAAASAGSQAAAPSQPVSASPAAAAPEEAAPPAPPDPSAAPVAPAKAPEKDPLADNKEHQNATRIARVMVADIFLYHRDAVLRGIREGNARELLQDQLAEARKTFQSRVAERVWKERDYLTMEFERLLSERSKDASRN